MIVNKVFRVEREGKNDFMTSLVERAARLEQEGKNDFMTCSGIRAV